MKQRQAINHPNLLNLIDIKSDEANLEINVFYEYFQDDVEYYVESINQSNKVFVKLTKDILNALIVLKKSKTMHGNLKPHFISFRHSDQNFVLIDPL